MCSIGSKNYQDSKKCKKYSENKKNYFKIPLKQKSPKNEKKTVCT